MLDAFFAWMLCFWDREAQKTEEKHDCMAVQKKGVVWDLSLIHI